MAKKLPWVLVLYITVPDEYSVNELWERARRSDFKNVQFPPMGLENMTDPGSWLIANEHQVAQIWMLWNPDDPLIDRTTDEGLNKEKRKRNYEKLIKAAKRLRIPVRNLY